VHPKMPITCKKKLFLLLVAYSLLFRFTNSVPSSECRTVVDLCLVIDGSDSISKADYDKQRDATANLMTNLDIGENRARVGIVVFSTTIAEEVPLSSDKDLLKKRAQSLPHPRDGTNTALAIKTMRAMFQSYGRPDTPWTGIVITDGISKDPKLTMEEAQKAREEGISLIAVGVTTLIDSVELLNIAGVESRVLKLESFDELKDALAGLAKTICPCDTPPVITHTVISPGPRTVGTVRLYECLEGYRGVGSGQIACLENSTWTVPTFECVACPEPPLITNAVVDPGDNLIKTFRNFRCNAGYIPSGPTVIECLANTTWSIPKFECILCGDTPIVPHSMILPGPNLIDTVRNYECEKGYIPVGPTNIKCKTDATWSPPEFQCVACMDPPVVPNAAVDVGSNLIGALRNYQCAKGFLVKGKSSIVCRADATWSPPEFICDVCGETPVVLNAVITTGDHFIGSVRAYQCDKGFLATGPTEIICKEDGLWSNPTIQCIGCLDLPLVQHALLEPGSNLIGSLRNYICEKGFVATGPTIVECLPSATWSPLQFTCVACTDPPLVSNSLVDIGSNLIGSVRTYTCKDGFVAKGKMSIVCQPDAHWSPPEFICDVCPETPILPHAVIGPGDNFIGSLRVYQCEKGFRATNPTEIVCLKDGTWSQPAFQCVACPEPPLVKNALIEPGSNLIGSVRQYVCEDGFLASGPTTIECSPDGGWTLPQFSCIVCGDTPLVTNAKIRPGSHLLGTARTYDCMDGYKAAGPTDILCLKDAMWSKPDFTCITCPEPPLVQNAVLEPGSSLIGIVRQYRCEKGYLATGPVAVECLADAVWSSPKFACIACQDPPLLQHALLEPGSNLIGSHRNYICEPGFVATGPTAVECLPDATWAPQQFTCIACTDPPLVSNSVVDIGSNLIGSVRTYTCKDGFVTKGKTSIVCQPDAHWSPPEFICDVCPEIPVVPHAVIGPGDNFVGSLRLYQCEKGFRATAPTGIVCQKDGTWSQPAFQCVACPEPPLIKNALIEPGSNLIGSVRQYVCEDGFLASGPTTIECSPDGGWTLPQFSCIVCADPPVVDNAVVTSGLNVIGTVRIYSCNLGYLAKGDTSIVCLKDATWSKPQFICDVCGPIPDVPNAIPLPGDHQIGSVIFYECMRGFIPDAPMDILCLNNGTWSSTFFSCKTCPEPPPVKHAFVNPGLLLIGSERQYMCDLGYLAKGDTGIVCQADATWSKTMFYCDVCGDLPIVKNAEILAGPHLIGSVRHYRCMDGLLATGPTDIICQKDATWSATAFQCIACGEVPLMENAVILSGSHLIGSIRKYECVKGFVPSSSTEIMCQKDATWSVPNFLCIACPKPPLVKNAVISPGENLIGSIRMYTCEEGYFAKGNTEIICLPDATWSAQTFVCDVCGPEPSVDNAIILPGSNLVGSFRFYQCAKGLVPSGSTKILCQKDGTWSLPMFNCIGCGIPPLVKNAVVSPGESLIGEFRSYTCNEGLIPTGPAGIFCQDNATWTAAEFTCAECRSLVDMIVVVDGSDSINAPGYEMLRGAIIQLIPELEMGDGKARVGIVVFSSDIHEVIPLTGNSTALISKVKYLYHPRDGTNTAKGIQKMREMFKSNGRPDVPWLGIVITDGISKQPLQTKQEAESAKAEGVYMIAVGITDKINQEELENISSSPKQVLQLETFGQLSKELVNLMRNVCRKKMPSLLQSIIEIKRE
ncbi:hypothetical protein ACJMK2_020432, partial [Sinanodonta woodiana]